jgi:hypothetical protein
LDIALPLRKLPAIDVIAHHDVDFRSAFGLSIQAR